MPHGDMPLLKRSVAWQVDGFHTVEERCGDCIETICCCDEEDFAQVNRDIYIVVSEGMILFRVQNFKHSC